MKLLNNVLVKLIRGGYTDRIMFIDNVPEEMFYELKYPLTVGGEGKFQGYKADTSKPKEMRLYEELTVSQTGDGAIVFDLDNEQSKTRYLTLKRYMDSVWPKNQPTVEAALNTVDASNLMAGPLSLDKIPRAVLPALSPADSSVAGSTAAMSAPDSVDVDAIKKQAVEEYKQEQKDRMAKAREARRAPIGKPTK